MPKSDRVPVAFLERIRALENSGVANGWPASRVARFGSVTRGLAGRRNAPLPVLTPATPSGDARDDSYLVDSASSHMLVSKIKPCMSKYKQLYGETANGSLNQLSFI
jgi:hypothetical protein